MGFFNFEMKNSSIKSKMFQIIDAKATVLRVETVMKNGIATILMKLLFGGILNYKGRKTDLH